MQKKYTFLSLAALFAGIIGYVAYRTRRVPTPKNNWKRFDAKGNSPINSSIHQQLQGVYLINEGKHLFGETAVAKWTYTGDDDKRVHQLSFFCEKEGRYIICEGRQEGNKILLQGHWRKAAANGTGNVQLIVTSHKIDDGVLTSPKPQEKINISGFFGDGNNEADEPLHFVFMQPLAKNNSLQIIGHRGGCRNVDFLPVSENSIAMFKLAASLGATGVEIDVRLTKDGVPVIFHDSFLSIHTVKNKLYGGLLHNYNYDELKTVELRKGGNIPTLEECLHTIVYHTPLHIIWLDIKKECNLTEVLKLQKEYLEKAATINRQIKIYIGVPDKKILECFASLENHKDIPSLCELETDDAKNINAEVWAPQYTGGTQKDKVDEMHGTGKKVFVWSLDNEFLIDTYITEGGFDGLVTNTPSVAAHWLYTKSLVNNEAQLQANTKI